MNYKSINNNTIKTYKDQVNDIDYYFKVLLVSNKNVGKSSFILRYCNDHYQDTYIYTIGNDCLNKFINIDNKIIKLQIWDSFSRYRPYKPPYRGTGICLLMYDITSLESFEECFSLLKDIKKNCLDGVIITLVGTKLDIVDMDSSKRQVSLEKAMLFSQKYNMDFMEVSSKFNINIDGIIIKSVLKAYSYKTNEENQIQIHNNKNNSNNKCIVN